MAHADDLARVVTDLAAAYLEYATCWEAEKRERARHYQSAVDDGSSSSAADTWAANQVITFAVATVQVGQQIKALEAERDYLMFCIDHGL